MDLKIFKYTLASIDRQTLELPKNAHILSVAEQHNNIVLYAIVDITEKEKYSYIVRVYGTGQSLSFDEDLEKFEFFGTVKLMDGMLMFHVFIGEGHGKNK